MVTTATIPISSIPIGTLRAGNDVAIHPEWMRFLRDIQVRTGGVGGIALVPSGGTGFSSYSVGDILYADTTTTFARLNAAATGNTLLSGASPSWGKVGLTTHVSGTLAEANGGTGFTAFGAGVSAWLQAATSANLLTAMTDPTGSGPLVFSISPTLVTPLLGTPTSGTLTNCTGYPASSLAGTTLAAGVVSSSLTSVGTLTNLTVTNPITGSVSGASGSTTGNAATATALQTARNINGVSFNGTADITVTAAAGTLTGATLAAGVTASSLTSVGTLATLTVGALTTTGNTVLGDASTDTLNVGNGGIVKDASGNVGIGTSTTTRKLNVGGVAYPDLVLRSTAASGGAGGGTLYFGNSGSDSVAYVSYDHTGNFLSFASNAVERLRVDSGGQVILSTAGKGLSVKEGANCKQGTATLVGGTVAVANTSVTANSRIFISRSTAGGTLGHLSYTKIAGTSFTVTSTSGTETSSFDYFITEPS